MNADLKVVQVIFQGNRSQARVVGLTKTSHYEQNK
jgi:hypothetical protein